MFSVLEFAVERYNYWIVIILMMTGLYTVITRGNLIKKMIGLNLFQTSVFIFYITIGKVSGGTAPIYVAGDMEKLAGVKEGAHGPPASDGASSDNEASLHGSVQPTPNRLDGGANVRDGASLHEPPADANSANTLNGSAADSLPDIEGAPYGSGAVIDTVYSNPLPSVLILTAIVVGIATTAVGLALAVRIREAYGSIEEDELLAADDLAEFGAATNSDGAAR